MILIGKTLVSEALFAEKFVCNLEACKGACCVRGDSGAPLEDSETQELKNIFRKVAPFLTERGINAIREQGHFVIDSDGEYATPLIDKKECAYTVFENGIAQCGIEKAWAAGVIEFRKPISCQLYPIRIKNLGEFEALNYDEWEICNPACALGKKLGVPVFRFLKDSIARKYGPEFFEEMERVYKGWNAKDKGGDL